MANFGVVDWSNGSSIDSWEFKVSVVGEKDALFACLQNKFNATNPEVSRAVERKVAFFHDPQMVHPGKPSNSIVVVRVRGNRPDPGEATKYNTLIKHRIKATEKAEFDNNVSSLASVYLAMNQSGDFKKKKTKFEADIGIRKDSDSKISQVFVPTCSTSVQGPLKRKKFPSPPPFSENPKFFENLNTDPGVWKGNTELEAIVKALEPTAPAFVGTEKAEDIAIVRFEEVDFTIGYSHWTRDDDPTDTLTELSFMVKEYEQAVIGQTLLQALATALDQARHYAPHQTGKTAWALRT
eukprot:TRINITY_DN11493_c0_g2_i1.p1 TRINITY_DN11493_c0_g2~~TRINITY_DN11493_c0_g2_i1.p1  ORF type:complete len:342 (+),score=35.77 TRINITY_DN11493_c0_g2_i1:143-1027(+)